MGRDEDYLREHGKLHGHFSREQEPKLYRRKGYELVKHGEFTSYDGEFRLSVTEPVKRSFNNWGAPRTDFWLVWEGRRYHGVQVGDSSTCATIKLVKGRK